MDVTSISVAKAQQIEDASIVSGSINASRQLILVNGAGAEINAGSVDLVPWVTFVPNLLGTGYTVNYARLKVVGNMCHVQLNVSNFLSSVFNPGFEAPVLEAAHYDIPPVAPGNIGKYFPGIVRWSGAANEPADIGAMQLQIADFGGGIKHWIMGTRRTGGALNFLFEDADQVFWETTYEIA